MKRIFALLLSFVLLLGGCAAQPKDESTMPTAPAFSVKTDYSSYTPPEHYNPAFGGTGITDLPTGEDYGLLYPFVGIFYASDENIAVPSERIYGFMDARGKVLVDPVYTLVEFLGDKDGGVWEMGKTDTTLSDGYPYNEHRYAVATMDGSKITDCRYSDITLCEDLVFAQEWFDDANYCRYDIYDLELNLITTSEKLLNELSLPETSLDYLSLRDGMYRLVFRHYMDPYNWSNNFYFTDLACSKLLGPYAWAHDFACGYAAVQEIHSDWFYIDKDGNALDDRNSMPGFYYSFEDGVAIVEDVYGDDSLLDTRGNRLLSANSAEHLDFENGYITLNQHDLNITAYYSAEGELLYPDFHPYEEGDQWGGFFPQEWKHLGNGIFFDSEEGELRNVLTGKTVSNRLFLDLYAKTYQAEDRSYIVISNDSYPHNQYYFYSMELEELLILENRWLRVETDAITGDVYFCLEAHEGFMQIYDKDWNLCLEQPWKAGTHSYAIYNGRVMYQNEQSCRYFDLKGEQLYEYPFVSNDG